MLSKKFKVVGALLGGCAVAGGGPPHWDDVKSTHPAGATNPPSPYLIVDRSSKACYKAWWPGMLPPTPEMMATDGVVVETAAELANQPATLVTCPDREPERLLQAHEAWVAAGRPSRY